MPEYVPPIENEPDVWIHWPAQHAESVLGPKVQRELEELMRLHDEAFDHWMKLDGCHKSSEGAITLHLTNVFERQDGEYPLAVKGVEVFAYVVGPSRDHYFNTVAEALATVRKWHAETMAVDIEARRREEAEAWASALNDGSIMERTDAG